MVWEIVIGVILVMGILTTIREVCSKRAGKKKAASISERSHDSNTP
jgi:hypothetical protein